MKKTSFFPVRFLAMALIIFFFSCSSSSDEDSSPIIPAPPVSPENFPFSDLGGGRLLYESAGETFGSLILADNTRKTISKFTLEGLHYGYKISPDGELMAYSAKTDLINHEYGIFVCSNIGKNTKRLIDTKKNGFNPGWTPDGSKIIFWGLESSGTSSYSLYSINKDGTNLLKITNQTTNLSFSAPSISSSGLIVFSTNTGYGNPINEAGIYLFDPSNQKLERIIPLETAKFFESPNFSPDGSKIAFLRLTRILEEYKLIEIILWDVNSKSISVLSSVNASGSTEYNFPDFGNQVTLAWSPDGSKIIFNVPEGNLTSHLYVVNSDGSSLKKITDGAKTTDFKVSWGR
ncbi:MAG: hypothetical protein PSV36_04255 [Algoriphagus sp.]|nr:hypothetical protein [Algoriphagus sp.]